MTIQAVCYLSSAPACILVASPGGGVVEDFLKE